MRSLLLLCCVACGPPAAELDLSPDPSRSGLQGEDGPFGAAHATYTTNVRVHDTLRFEVQWPALVTTTLV